MESKIGQQVAQMEIWGVRVDGVTMVMAVALIVRWLERENLSLRVVLTPNVEMVMAAQDEVEFKEALDRGDLNVADSMGLVWADKKLAQKEKRERVLTERVAGVDLAEKVCAEAAERGDKVFLVGGRARVAEKAVDNLKRKIKGLKIEGFEGPHNALQETQAEWGEVKRRLQAFEPKMVLVAFGAPAQELWVMRHKSELAALGVRVVMVVGGAVDVWAGNVVRAPLRWRKNGWEWLWRLIHEPWRWRRQMALVRFVGGIWGIKQL